MSRAYRITVRETHRTVLRAADHIEAQLEWLPILPAQRLAQLLSEQLQAEGFECDEQTGRAVAELDEGLRVTVDLSSGQTTLEVRSEQEIELTAEHERRVEDGAERERAEEALRQEVGEQLRQEAAEQQAKLQSTASSRLETAVQDVLAQLDRAVHRTTAEALKEKARQLGQVKELVEDQERGSLTIVLEV